MIPLYFKVACALFFIGLVMKLLAVSLGIDWSIFQVGLTFTTIALGMLIGGYFTQRAKNQSPK